MTTEFCKCLFAAARGNRIWKGLKRRYRISSQDGIVLIASDDEDLIKYVCTYAEKYRQYIIPGTKERFRKLWILNAQSENPSALCGENVEVISIPNKWILPLTELCKLHQLHNRITYFVIASWDYPEGRETKLFVEQGFINTEDYVIYGIYGMQ